MSMHVQSFPSSAAVSALRLARPASASYRRSSPSAEAVPPTSNAACTAHSHLIVRMKCLLEELRIFELCTTVHRTETRHTLLHLATQPVKLLHFALVANVILLCLDLMHPCDAHFFHEGSLLLGSHLLPSFCDDAEDVALSRLITEFFSYLLESLHYHLPFRLHRAAVACVRAHCSLRLSQSDAVLGLDSPVVYHRASLHIELVISIHVHSCVHVTLGITRPLVGNDGSNCHFALDTSLMRYHCIRLRMTPNMQDDLDEGNTRDVGTYQFLVAHCMGHSRVRITIHRQTHSSARIIHHCICGDTDRI